MLRPAFPHPGATAQQPRENGGMLRLAGAQPSATAQQPGGKGRMIRPAITHPCATAHHQAASHKSGILLLPLNPLKGTSK